ncbi:MAG TPA: hypothetical protein VGV35_21405 [Bryobacteraceae bacterium]|nr:hypothetical protein [Bryobacteraceae bacterium]
MPKLTRPKTSRKSQTKNKPQRLRQAGKVKKQSLKLKQPSKLKPGSLETVKAAPSPDPELVIYERAIAFFNAGRLQAAKDTFAELLNARNRDLAHSAELRIRMCEHRLAPNPPATLPEFD